MRKKTNILLAAFFLSMILILTGCKKEDPPTVNTAAITEVTLNSARAGGTVSSDGGAEVTVRGVVWGTVEQPTTSNNFTTDGTGTGDFESMITGLTEGTTYYVRAYATNSEGTSYGAQESFITSATAVATLTTRAATEITSTGAITGGNITDDGQLEITARGVAWGIAANPTIEGTHTSDGTGKGEFNSTLTGLVEGTKYYVRAYATNAKGTAYGNEISFTTVASALATVTTAEVTNLTSVAGVSGGNVTNDGGAPVTARGLVWGTTSNPTVEGNHTSDGAGAGAFTSNMTDLSDGTVYYVRSYATNKVGTSYGNEIRIITPVTDVEGNVYKTTQIGNQVWMAENLRTTKYRNNSDIPHVADSVAYLTLTGPAYSWFRNNAANKPMGALYSWFTVATGNLCPQGWHVPTNAEFQTMEVVAGVPADSVDAWGWRGNGVGTKLKDSIGWLNTNGTNTLGFSGQGTGYRAWTNAEFRGKNEISYYWSATDDAVNAKPTVAYYRRLDAGSPYIYKATTGKAGGKSVRCVKNQ